MVRTACPRGKHRRSFCTALSTPRKLTLWSLAVGEETSGRASTNRLNHGGPRSIEWITRCGTQDPGGTQSAGGRKEGTGGRGGEVRRAPAGPNIDGAKDDGRTPSKVLDYTLWIYYIDRSCLYVTVSVLWACTRRGGGGNILHVD